MLRPIVLALTLSLASVACSSSSSPGAAQDAGPADVGSATPDLPTVADLGAVDAPSTAIDAPEEDVPPGRPVDVPIIVDAGAPVRGHASVIRARCGRRTPCA